MIAIHPVTGIGEISSGENLGKLFGEALSELRPVAGDVLVVTQKIVSKAEGRLVSLQTIQPGLRAQNIAEKIGRDPRVVELVLRESTAVLRAERGILITRHRLGLVMANAGIDASNLGPGLEDHVLLLPEDPDASALRIADAIRTRFGLDIGVIISDSFGRPWRQGVVNVAVGAAGLSVLLDKRGTPDRNGRPMQSTQIAVADLIASGAGLAMGEAAEGVPAALVRGLDLPRLAQSASVLIRPLEEDMFQ